MSDERIRACPGCGQFYDACDESILWCGACGWCVSPEKIFAMSPEVERLKAENAEMLAALMEIADCPYCINGNTIPEPCSGEAIGDCSACAPARKVLAKIKGESNGE